MGDACVEGVFGADVTINMIIGKSSSALEPLFIMYV